MTVMNADIPAAEKKKKKKRHLTLVMPKGSDYAIYWSLMALAFYGLLMIVSSSMGLAVGNPGYLVFVFAKQLLFLMAGYVLMTWSANHFKFDFLKSGGFLLAVLVMAGLLLACLLFPSAGGARAWLRIPVTKFDMSIQPSEFCKVLVPMIVAAYCGDVKKRYDKSFHFWIRPVLIILIYILIIMFLQDDTGSAIVIFLIGWFCLLIPNHPNLRGLQRTIRILTVLGAAGVIFLLATPVGEQIIRRLPLQDYQVNRFLSAINPFTDRFVTGYQLVSGLIGFASGGWFGLGFGNSVRKYTDFPAANTDFILAIVVEEMGIVGFLLIFIPYMIIIMRLYHYAVRIKSERARIILTGTMLYLVIHCLFNIGGVTGLIPLTGVPLLMISSGGSSTLAFMASIGVSQAVISQYNQGKIQ